MEQCKKQLDAHLFILHPQLCPALLRVQGQCVANSENQLMAAIEPLTTYTLEEFKTVHIAKMKLVRTVVEIILYPDPPMYKACIRTRNACELLGNFVPLGSVYMTVVKVVPRVCKSWWYHYV